MNRSRRNLTFTVSGALLAGSFALTACPSQERTNIDPIPERTNTGPDEMNPASAAPPTTAPPASAPPASAPEELPTANPAPEEELPNANPGPEEGNP